MMKELLYGMSFLEEGRMVHGNIRPELISVPVSKEDNFRLLDRLADPSPPIQNQMNNFQNHKDIYMAPVFFTSFLSNSLKIRHNPFKSDSFSLGMVILEAGLLQSVQSVYNRNSPDFQIDKQKLIFFVEKFISLYSQDEVLIEALMIMLEFGEALRQTPSELLDSIKYMQQTQKDKNRLKGSAVKTQIMSRLKITESGYEVVGVSKILGQSNFYRFDAGENFTEANDMELSLVEMIKKKRGKKGKSNKNLNIKSFSSPTSEQNVRLSDDLVSRKKRFEINESPVEKNPNSKFDHALSRQITNEVRTWEEDETESDPERRQIAAEFNKQNLMFQNIRDEVDGTEAFGRSSEWGSSEDDIYMGDSTHRSEVSDLEIKRDSSRDRLFSVREEAESEIKTNRESRDSNRTIKKESKIQTHNKPREVVLEPKSIHERSFNKLEPLDHLKVKYGSEFLKRDGGRFGKKPSNAPIIAKISHQKPKHERQVHSEFRPKIEKLNLESISSNLDGKKKMSPSIYNNPEKIKQNFERTNTHTYNNKNQNINARVRGKVVTKGAIERYDRSRTNPEANSLHKISKNLPQDSYHSQRNPYSQTNRAKYSKDANQNTTKRPSDLIAQNISDRDTLSSLARESTESKGKQSLSKIKRIPAQGPKHYTSKHSSRTPDIKPERYNFSRNLKPEINHISSQKKPTNQLTHRAESKYNPKNYFERRNKSQGTRYNPNPEINYKLNSSRNRNPSYMTDPKPEPSYKTRTSNRNLNDTPQPVNRQIYGGALNTSGRQRFKDGNGTARIATQDPFTVNHRQLNLKEKLRLRSDGRERNKGKPRYIVQSPKNYSRTGNLITVIRGGKAQKMELFNRK